MNLPKPQNDPFQLYHSINENHYKLELELLDRYQSFSAEIVRLSLLGIAAFAFIFEKVLINKQLVSDQFAMSFILFGAAVIFALEVLMLSVPNRSEERVERPGARTQ